MATPSVESTPAPTLSSPSTGSEKENRQNGTAEGRQKRKRGEEREGRSRMRRRALDPDGEESNEEQARLRSPSAHPEDYFDPAQSIKERRKITRQLRDLQKDLTENQDEYINDDGSKIMQFLRRSDRVMTRVKQTNEATIDAKGLLKLSDIHSKRVNQSIAGHTQQGGVDIDEFVSKCLTFMLQGGGIEDDDAPELSSTQRQRRAPNRSRGAIGSDDEDAAAEGDAYNWQHLGRFAAVPNINRPAVPGFMLGPLSVKKKARKFVQRTAPLRIQNLVEVRPQVLNAEDMARNEKNDLTVICKKILKQLERVQGWAQDKVEDELNKADLTDEEQRAVMDKYSLRDTGGIDLLRFVVNPHSFGQTVENIFYVSFLIRDGYVKLGYDSLTKLPALEHVARDEMEDHSAARGALRHQSILSIDMPTWQDVIEAFNIKEPMIPHRRELNSSGGPGAKGWYS